MEYSCIVRYKLKLKIKLKVIPQLRRIIDKSVADLYECSLAQLRPITQSDMSLLYHTRNRELTN